MSKQKSEKPPKQRSVRDYLDGLVWDQEPRIERWLIDYAGAPNTPHVRAVSLAVLVAAVRRVRQPGCKLDEMLVLEAPQGSGKSSALRILAVEDDWFGDDLPLDDRALIEATAGKWIVEAAELRRLGEGDVAALKACLSRPVDEARMAYQHERARVPRRFVIVGTTSETDYLRDTTNNRRFWPVRVQRFDLETLRRDRDQLWAEAAVAEAAGESICVADQLWAKAVADQLWAEAAVAEATGESICVADLPVKEDPLPQGDCDLSFTYEQIDLITCALAYLRDNGPHPHEYMNQPISVYDAVFQEIETALKTGKGRNSR